MSLFNRDQPQQGYNPYAQQPLYPQLPGRPNQPPTTPGQPGALVAPQGPTSGGHPNPFHLPSLPHLHLHHHPSQPPAPAPAPAPYTFGSSGLGGGWGSRATAGAYAAAGYAPASASQLQQPQQLETVGKDEDPVYGPLSRARGKIDRAIVSDNEISPDLAEQFAPTSEPPYLPPPTQTNAFRTARITKTTPLPDALHQELNYKHLTARMGLFEEIERAWFAVDNKLFLWNYNDGRDFSRYDQQTDTIQTVGLVRARKDVFVDDITHLLVICTATKITLLGLSRSDKGELSLYATNLSTDTSTGFLDIRGTDSGRIFLLGVDKDLYELEYSTGGGWLSGGSKAWLSNRSSGYLSTWVPSVFSSANREGVESFVLDPQQGRLFALHTKGEIEYIDVQASRFESRARYVALRNDFQRLGYGGAAPGYAGAKVVSIAIVGAEESKKAWVVAISASGARAYLGTAAFYSQYATTASLQVLGHRPPPPETTKADAQSFYSSGTFIGVHYSQSPTPTARLTFVTPAPGRQSSVRENYETFHLPALQEWSSVDTVPSQVWTIAEVAATNPSRSPPALCRDDGIALSALPRQTTAYARQFLILTPSGIFWAVQPRPIDMLEADIGLEKDTGIHAGRAAFGRVQLASMGVQMGANADKNKQSDLISISNNILLVSEPPVIRQASNGARSIVYSARHDGLALILGRLLRPIWNAKVVVPAGPKKFKLGVTDKGLHEVQGRLADLRRFTEDHPFPRHQAEGDAKLAWDQEELSLHGLQVLLKQAIEAISFVLLLNDYKLPDVIAKCNPSTQSTLASLTFQGLLTSQGGRDTARHLVTALIELQIGQELGIDTLSAILQERCGTFVQSGDVVLYKAEESLRRAENTRDAIERQENLSESLDLFTRASSSAAAAVFPRLPDATRRYRTLNDVRGTIELPLRVATDIDPDDKAGDFVRDGRNPGDPRAAFLQQRQECYQLVVEALNSYDEKLDKAVAAGNPSAAVNVRDQAYAFAIASDDELFHFYLYDWTIEMNRADQLLEFDTPFIERYLQITESNVPERRDLLWKYYARREEFLKASKALHDLATRPSDLGLQERVYYLAQALANAKSAMSIGSEDVEFTTALQERIDVAQVQLEVVGAVEGHLDMDRGEKNSVLEHLNSELMTLDDLYLQYARPLRLYEPILLILKTADTRIEDVCEAVWRELIAERSQDTPLDAAVGELVTDLCRKYYPSEAAPSDIVLPVVYGEAAPHRAATEAGWASKALLAGGVGLRDLWDAVVALHDEAVDYREYYAEEAATLITVWLDNKTGLPPADVEQFASAYMLRTNGVQLDQRLSDTRNTMSKAKNTAGQF
ncbi:putative nucleoporin [Vanrija pseudolonga]|uniref:Nucleoporin n=1 Tax=Vanrija pseudolonga TaxID=143232 RepID=A0AAF0Y933_9TREE|nr:putative nucleoporin [Vanrija pseudolonga]